MNGETSIVLRVRGADLDPPLVSHCLGLESHRASSRNDPIQLSGEGSDEFVQLNLLRPMGSWQRYAPPELVRQGVEAQLEYWADLLKSRRAALKQLIDQGLEPVLSCYVQVEGAVAFRIPASLMRRLARLGVALDFSVLKLDETEPVPTTSDAEAAAPAEVSS